MYFKRHHQESEIESSGQDGGVGGNLSFPHPTKRRITTNLKSINYQKCQKIKLHGNPTTEELKKKSTRTTRPVRLQSTPASLEKPRGTGRAGLTEGETETQRWLWATAVATVGETPSFTQSVGKCATNLHCSLSGPSLHR